MDVCIFCRNQTDDEIRFGKILKLDKITVHQHCMFLSPALIQNGAEHEGLMGFLPRDLLKETRRAAKLTCSFCKKKGASLGCEERKCSKKFHLPCGLKNGTLHQHFGEYHSFCHKHRPKQDQPDNPQNPGDRSSNCVICFEEVKPSDDKLYAPCCRKEACFHRNCIQQTALNAGYQFRCPLCNNEEEFVLIMKKFGIYVPSQDAAWEQENNAFGELLVRHRTCDSRNCACPTGRQTNNRNTKWELILCQFCGSQGVHVSCGKLESKNPTFSCSICLPRE